MSPLTRIPEEPLHLSSSNTHHCREHCLPRSEHHVSSRTEREDSPARRPLRAVVRFYWISPILAYTPLGRSGGERERVRVRALRASICNRIVLWGSDAAQWWRWWCVGRSLDRSFRSASARTWVKRVAEVCSGVALRRPLARHPPSRQFGRITAIT